MTTSGGGGFGSSFGGGGSSFFTVDELDLLRLRLLERLARVQRAVHGRGDEHGVDDRAHDRAARTLCCFFAFDSIRLLNMSLGLIGGRKETRELSRGLSYACAY